MTKLLSKSDYMLFLKHPAWLWVKKHDPSKIPPVDENTQAIFDAGHKFEPYAESLFPEGASLGFSNYDEYLSLPQRTKDAIDQGKHVLFQPRFEWNEFTCISDVVQFLDEGEVDLYEIKASTSVKTDHIFDLAFQAAVLEGNGFEIRNLYVIHVNNQYVRQGAIEADKITHIQDVTELVREKGNETEQSMAKALEVMNSEVMPDSDPKFAAPGTKQDWLKIYANIVPQQPEVVGTDVVPDINRKEIAQFLEGIKYPLFFLDYETMSGVIPYFDGHRPYQQIPFQYSLHVLSAPDSELEQREYLHRDNSDPSRPLVEQLLKDIGSRGTVLVWYEQFEKSRNTELSRMLPEYAEAMEAINDRIVDLIIPFKQKWYDDPRFGDSASIKSVLPVLVPDLSYKDLAIQEGGSAQRLWMEATLDEKRANEKDAILSDLIEYCKLDTLAMVEIYRKLASL
jgi:hypothetical protein